jgi:hypothetical protein
MNLKNALLFSLLVLSYIVGSLPSDLQAPPSNTWFDRFRILTDIRVLAPIRPTEPTPPPPLNASGTLKSFVSGDNIADQFRYNKPAEVACKAVFQASTPLYDGSTETVEIVVPFFHRFPEDEDYTPPLQVVCHALEHAVEAQVPVKIEATVKNWGSTPSERTATLSKVTLHQMDEAAVNALPMGTVGCEGTEKCVAEGIPVRFETRVLPPEVMKEVADFCSADLSTNNGAARFRVRVNYQSPRLTGLYDKTVPEKAMYSFYVVQQCRNLAMGLCAQKISHAEGPVEGAGIVRAKTVTVLDPEAQAAQPATP